jgi:hypothetical protein
MLRLYGLWLKRADLAKKGRVGRTGVESHDWAKSRGGLIRKRKHKYCRRMFPAAVRAFAEGLKAGEILSVSDDCRAFMMYLAKAKMLASNAWAGTFPGHWRQ